MFVKFVSILPFYVDLLKSTDNYTTTGFIKETHFYRASA